jgi:C1A family cysteine protease
MKNHIAGYTISENDPRDFLYEYTRTLPGVLQPPMIPEKMYLGGNLFGVRSQGEDGACVAFACACMKDWQEHMDPSSKVEDTMSPLFLYNLRGNRPFPGMTPRNALDILRTRGIVEEKDFPYDLGMKKLPNTSLLEKAKRYRISGYAAVKTIQGLKQALATNGVCIIVVPVYNLFERFWKPTRGDPMKGYHCLAVIGYNEDGFILRNSWGDSWNGNGETVFPYVDWGIQVECWTAIDEMTTMIAKSNRLEPKEQVITFRMRIGAFFNTIHMWILYILHKL